MYLYYCTVSLTPRAHSGVEIHVYPNVRILVLGDLVAEGTPWQPIRFKPINNTELEQVTGDNAFRLAVNSNLFL